MGVPYMRRLTREGKWNKEGRKREPRQAFGINDWTGAAERGMAMGLSGIRKLPFGTIDLSEWRLFVF